MAVCWPSTPPARFAGRRVEKGKRKMNANNNDDERKQYAAWYLFLAITLAVVVAGGLLGWW